MDIVLNTIIISAAWCATRANFSMTQARQLAAPRHASRRAWPYDHRGQRGGHRAEARRVLDVSCLVAKVVHCNGRFLVVDRCLPGVRRACHAGSGMRALLPMALAAFEDGAKPF